MEPEQVRALCIAIQSPTCIIIGTQPQQRLFFQDVSEVKLHLADNKVSSTWVEAVQYLIKHVEGRQVEYTVSQKRKTFSYGKVLVSGSDIIAEMLSRGLLKLVSTVQGLTDLEKEAQTAKIGLWNDRRVSLNSLSEIQAKRNYLVNGADVIKRCYVERVEGLKMFLIDLDTLEEFVWYMSQLQIPRMNGLDPRKAFVTTEDYIKDKLGKTILKCKVRGCEIYKGEVSLYGVVNAGQSNLALEVVRAGYAQLSKNAQAILESGLYKQMVLFQKQAKLKGYGFFKKKIDKEAANTAGLNISNKMKQYEHWIKEQRRANSLRNPSEQLSDILSNYKIEAKEQLTDGKMKKIRTLSQVCAGLLTGSTDRYREELKEFYSKTCGLFWLVSGQLVINVDSTQYIKLINALLRSIIACMSQTSEKQNLAEVEKLMRTVFRLVFIGNNIFHSKIFDKQKEIDFQNFSFDNCDFSSSSMSEISDDQRPDKEHIKKKRLNDAYLKVRISSSLLIHLMLKLIPNLMETNWELIVKPNIFEKQFTDFVNSLSFKAQVPILKSQEKERIVNLMKINFGEHSLLSMLIFQTNLKIKVSILKSLQLFTCNYQGRKIIQTIEFAKFEKEIKQTKSFIPKSFLVFSAYKNLYHTLLFCLYYERDPELKVLFFKALTNIIEHTSILEKIPFQQGLKFLLDNFILPILDTDNHGSDQLRLAAVECLSKIVSVKGKLEQFQNEYLCSRVNHNILLKLIQVLRECNSATEGEDQMLKRVYNFFTQIVINHLEPFIMMVQQQSYWEAFQKQSDTESEGFAKVIQEICKEIHSTDPQDQNQVRQAGKSKQAEDFKKMFLQQYLPKYLQQCQNLNSPTSLINRINIFCQLKSDIWSNPLYYKPSLFLLEVFQRLGSDPIRLENQEQSLNLTLKLEDMRNNPYVKVAYLRLVGYLSFIEKFRTDQIAKHVFKTILTSIKSAKGLNTLTKCSWALSSWSGFPNLANILTKDEVGQVFGRLIEFARSDKEKIASHGARGLGLFASTVANKSSLVQSWIEEIKDSLITNMKNKSPKVSWNCLVSLRTIMKVPNLKCQDLIGGRVIESLIYNFSRGNFKLQLQTIQTLKCLPQQEYINKYFLEVSKGIMKVLQQTNKQELTEYSFAEFKYVDTLRRQVVRYFVAILARLNDSQKLKCIILNVDLYLLLASVYKHLLSICVRGQQPQKSSYIEEKGKEKGEETQKEVFNVKKKTVFDEEQVVSNVQLLGYQKIILRKNQDEHFFAQLKLVSAKIKELIQEDQSFKVNFSVVEGFQQLGHMRISPNSVQANLFQL